MVELEGGWQQLQRPFLSQMRLLPTSDRSLKFRPDPGGRRSCWRSRRPSCSWPLPPQRQPRPRVRDRSAATEADRWCLKTGIPVRSAAICASSLALPPHAAQQTARCWAAPTARGTVWRPGPTVSAPSQLLRERVLANSAHAAVECGRRLAPAGTLRSHAASLLQVVDPNALPADPARCALPSDPPPPL